MARKAEHHRGCRQRNLVSLRGCCIATAAADQGKKMFVFLVYDYMHKGCWTSTSSRTPKAKTGGRWRFRGAAQDRRGALLRCARARLDAAHLLAHVVPARLAASRRSLEW